MDEPLSNLDAKLRVQMRAELIRLHNVLNTTFVYVTHDQTEAMTMGSRICVMKDGIIKQIATPEDIYNTELLGSEVYVHLHVQGEIHTVKTDASVHIKAGDIIKVIPARDKIHLFNPETESAII